VFDECRVNGTELQLKWITIEVCDRHRNALLSVADDAAPALLDDVAFWEYCAYNNVRGLATACINAQAKRAAHHATQSVLPEVFEHLQTEYVIERDGVARPISIHEATNEELTARAYMYLANGAQMIAHGNELLRFVEMREAEAAADDQQAHDQ
jgi:hypothetical protein